MIQSIASDWCLSYMDRRDTETMSTRCWTARHCTAACRHWTAYTVNRTANCSSHHVTYRQTVYMYTLFNMLSTDFYIVFFILLLAYRQTAGYVQYFQLHRAGVTNMSLHYNLSTLLWRYIGDIGVWDIAAPATKTTDLCVYYRYYFHHFICQTRRTWWRNILHP